MRFWDSSALVALLVDESDSTMATQALAEDSDVAAWWGTKVECGSAVHRRRRAGSLDRSGSAQALDLLSQLAASWFEILPSETLRAEAERALAVHALRATDALQLAAALIWRGAASAAAEFVCLDDRLRDAASGEGFRLLPG